MVRYANNANVSRYLRDRFPYPYTMAHARGFLAGAVGEEGEPTKFAIAVDDEAVGGIGLIPGADIEQFSAEIGYWLGEPFWGRGIAPGAVCDGTRLPALEPAAAVASLHRDVGSGGWLEKRAMSARVLKSVAVKQDRSTITALARVNASWRAAG